VPRKNDRIKLTAIILLILITMVSCFGPSFKGEVAKPVDVAPKISMTDQNGNSFQLTDYRGKVVLVSFGFTNCVDECPLTMAHFKQALETLGDQADNVQVLMVSTDPIRDTPQELGEFLAKFSPTFLGITGPLDEMKTIWDEYGVTVLDGGETHSSRTYVIDQEGIIRLYFYPETSPEDIASDLGILLAEK